MEIRLERVADFLIQWAKTQKGLAHETIYLGTVKAFGSHLAIGRSIFGG